MKRINNKASTYLAVVGCTVFLLSALLFYSTKAAPPALPKITIATSQTPLSAPFIIAKHIGAFKQAGVDAELIPCIGGMKCAAKMLSGQSDFATSSESVVMFESFKHPDIRLLVSFVASSNDLKLLSLQKSNIVNVDQLSGKRVGVIQASASEFFLDSHLIAANTPSNSVEKVYLAPSA
ncbi:ABC transporter substrate-binding protein [Vibrio sonorensis]|uniref:ABC transporter substrate-binding protein n=1 Tax=Vibrio sonorensis TaxID=1004316 RepID=UPI001FE09FCD|nr:ABC transporter substrate-binding protein [Vibrio sonorensis]